MTTTPEPQNPVRKAIADHMRKARLEYWQYCSKYPVKERNQWVREQTDNALHYLATTTKED